mgnify:CR=1 FL=1
MQDISAILHTLPVPTPPILSDPMPETTSAIVQQIHRIFDHTIQCYKPDIQTRLHAIYYTQKQVGRVKNLFESKGFRANWQATLYADLRYIINVQVDPRLIKSPLLYHLSMLHEVAGHVGQVDALLSRSDLLYHQKRDVLHHPQFSRFLEQSAARMEKPLIDALPETIIHDACNRVPAPWGDHFWRYHQHKRALSPDQYGMLHHRLVE